MNKRSWTYLISTLVLVAIISWQGVLAFPNNNLRIIACDVGQGSATLIEKGRTQILVDGGPNGSVVSCLSRHMSFWDRNIEVVILTHPDSDHFSGLIDVFENYNVEKLVSTEINGESAAFDSLVEVVGESKAEIIYARTGSKYSIGNISIDILNPSLDVLGAQDDFENEVLASAFVDKKNNLSVVFELSYLEFKALFTGDIEDVISDQIADKYALDNLEYLQIPHHGSKNGLSEKLFNEVSPELAVISVGKNNRFGHPHSEVLDLLTGTKTLRTDEMRDIVVETDGNGFSIR
jgi:competence protein ComEC